MDYHLGMEEFSNFELNFEVGILKDGKFIPLKRKPKRQPATPPYEVPKDLNEAVEEESKANVEISEEDLSDILKSKKGKK